MRRSWPRWAHVWAAIGSIAAGFAFSRVVAGNDYKMQTFLVVMVSLGLFIVTSSLASQLLRRRRPRRPAHRTAAAHSDARQQ
jgi:predicted permease